MPQNTSNHQLKIILAEILNISSDRGANTETLTLEPLYDGQFAPSTLLKKTRLSCSTPPLTQEHSFYKSLPLLKDYFRFFLAFYNKWEELSSRSVKNLLGCLGEISQFGQHNQVLIVCTTFSCFYEIHLTL